MTQFNQPDDMPTPNQLRIAELEETIAELRERHEAFVRKIREQAGDERFTDAYSINRIIALCDAELSGEQSNG